MPFATVQQQTSLAIATVSEIEKQYKEGLICAMEYGQKLLDVAITLHDSAVGSKCTSCHDVEACAEIGCQCIPEKQ